MTDPPARAQTERHAVLGALSDRATLSARDISEAVGLSEREVVAHLAHLVRQRHGERLVWVQPARCVSCEFSFAKRERLTRPSRCPVCRSERIEAPRFGLKPRSGRS